MFDKLKAPFDPAKISWRVGSMTKDKAKGMALAYIDARDVMDRLDEVCSPAGWACRYPHATGKTVCAIGIKIGEEWVWKEDGAGDSDIEAEKGALSDAFKRAAVRWGIGRYLYDIASPWVDLDEYKHIKPSETGKLQRALGTKATVPVAASKPAPVSDDPFSDPPVKPVEPAVSKEAIGFAREIRSLKTSTDLEAFKRTPEFKAAFKRMNAADQQYLISAGTEKATELDNAVDYRMAG